MSEIYLQLFKEVKGRTVRLNIFTECKTETPKHCTAIQGQKGINIHSEDDFDLRKGIYLR